MVPVPADRLGDVYALLASPAGRTGAPSAPAAPTPAGSADEEDDTPWDDISLRRLWVESSTDQRRVLEYLAEHAGQEVTSRQIAVALALPKGAKSLAGIVGGMDAGR
jgi:hypothetical protein